MAHDIYRDSTGKDCMFVVGERSDAWHLLGQRCEAAVSWEQAVELSGLNWEVLKQQNYARNPAGKVVPTDINDLATATTYAKEARHTAKKAYGNDPEISAYLKIAYEHIQRATKVLEMRG